MDALSLSHTQALFELLRMLIIVPKRYYLPNKAIPLLLLGVMGMINVDASLAEHHPPCVCSC